MTVGDRKKRTIWVLARDEDIDLMTLSDGDGGEALPVFGFEQEARLFVRLLGREEEWRIRETTVGELTPLLHGPYAGIGKVALDPVPEGVNSSGPLDVAWPSREEFLAAFRSQSGDA